MATYRYKAFISYSHRDEKWARWLHRSLESYRIPRRLAARITKSDLRLRPVFRDRDELASSSDLNATIRQALTESEFLLVICSAASAQSRWVAEEIAYFIEQGRADRIFCLIVDSHESFPGALAGREPLAADARESGDGRRRALLKLVAGMLSVGFDDLVQRDLQQSRRTAVIRGSWLAGAMTVAAAMALWIGRPDPCPDPEPLLTGIWDAQSKARLQETFAATGLPYAAASAERVSRLLDSYATQWRNMHVAACRATRVAGSQSDALLDTRMRCLDERLLALEALSDELQQADPQTVERSTAAALDLGDIAACADTDVLSRTYPAPAPEQEAAVTQLERRLAQAKAAFSTGKVDSARESLEQIRAQAEQIDYPPLTAEVLIRLGQVLAEQSNPELAEVFPAGLDAAVTARNDAVITEGWIAYVHALSESLGELESARQYLLPSRLAAARLSPDHPMAASMAGLEGAVAFREGKLEAARKAVTSAIQIATEIDSPQLPRFKLNLGVILAELAEYDQAREISQQAYVDLVSQHGPAHPEVSEPLMTLGAIAEQQGDLEGALSYMQRAMQIRRDAYGDSPNESLALSTRAVGWMLKELGRLDEARSHLNLSLQIYRKLENPPDYQIANLLNAIADLETYAGNLEEGERLFTAALEAWQHYPDNPNVAIPLSNLGALQARTGRFEDALATCGRVLELDEATLGSQHPDLSYSLTCIGMALIGLERAEEAVGYLERAVQLRAGGKSWEAAWARFQLGRALWVTGKRERALQEIELAQQQIEKSGSPDPWILSTITGWQET